MLTAKHWGTIDEYLKLSTSVTEIARRLGISRPTIYKRKKEVEQNKHLGNEDIAQQIESELSKYEQYIKKALKRKITSCEVIHTILQEVGCTHSYDTTNRLVRKVKARMKKHYQPSTKRDTYPGEEAQMDWGYYGEALVDGKKRKVWFFAYVLGYCRRPYIEFVVNQNRKTLKQCHINTFKKLGVPRRIVYDNMKTVVKERRRIDGEDYIKISSEFLDFAQCLGFEIFVCAPHHPRSKGKVENLVKFVKKNFIPRFRYRYKSKSKVTLYLLNQEVEKWINEQDERIHDETHQKPNVLWREEKQHLHFPDVTKLDPLINPMVTRKVSKDGYVFYKNYAPFQLSREYIEESVAVKEINEYGIAYIEIYLKNKVIAKFLLSNENVHVNLIAKEKGKKEIKKKISKTSHSSQKNETPIIPEAGFYQPEGYYDKLTTYDGGSLWGKR